MSTEQADPTIARVEGVERDLRGLQDDVAMTDIQDALGEIDAQVRDLPGAIQALRSRGYVFKKYLENKAQVLTGQWADMRGRVMAAVDEQSRLLREQADQAQQRVTPLRWNRDEGEVAAVESVIADLESRLRAATRAIQNMYEPLRENISQTAGQIKEVAWTLDQVDAASFKLYPGEGVVAAVKAQWMTSEKEGPKGIFYVTEDRLLFEQREEVATKKVLFITTEKQKLQELKWQAAVGQVEQVTASEQGGAILGIGKKELLGLGFDNRVPIRQALLRLEADSDAWQALIGRVKSGDIAGERTCPRDEAIKEAVRAAPTKCPTCGAGITQAIVRGMNEIKCEYCGAVIRL